MNVADFLAHTDELTGPLMVIGYSLHKNERGKGKGRPRLSGFAGKLPQGELASMSGGNSSANDINKKAGILIPGTTPGKGGKYTHAYNGKRAIAEGKKMGLRYSQLQPLDFIGGQYRT